MGVGGGGCCDPPMGVLGGQSSLEHFLEFLLNWLQNCFVGLQNKFYYMITLNKFQTVINQHV